VVGGALTPHPDSATFEGCQANVIVTALKREIEDQDTQVKVDQIKDSVVVTVLQSQQRRQGYFSPAMTVTASDLSGEAKRNTLGSVGRTVLDQGKRMVFRRRGVGGLLETAGNVMDGVENLVEDIQDLGLPKRVWAVIDRVGEAAEQAYLDEKRKQQELQWQREAAERAWTHCEACGRAYRDDEGSRVDCPACGGVRGDKPDWLKYWTLER